MLMFWIGYFMDWKSTYFDCVLEDDIFKMETEQQEQVQKGEQASD
jgi:hypothetical protein